MPDDSYPKLSRFPESCVDRNVMSPHELQGFEVFLHIFQGFVFSSCREIVRERHNAQSATSSVYTKVLTGEEKTYLRLQND